MVHVRIPTFLAVDSASGMGDEESLLINALDPNDHQPPRWCTLYQGQDLNLPPFLPQDNAPNLSSRYLQYQNHSLELLLKTRYPKFLRYGDLRYGVIGNDPSLLTQGAGAAAWSLQLCII